MLGKNAQLNFNALIANNAIFTDKGHYAFFHSNEFQKNKRQSVNILLSTKQYNSGPILYRAIVDSYRVAHGRKYVFLFTHLFMRFVVKLTCKLTFFHVIVTRRDRTKN